VEVQLHKYELFFNALLQVQMFCLAGFAFLCLLKLNFAEKGLQIILTASILMKNCTNSAVKYNVAYLHDYTKKILEDLLIKLTTWAGVYYV